MPAQDPGNVTWNDHLADRHFDIETTQLGLSNAAHKLIVTHLQAVAGGAEVPLLVSAG